MTEDKNIGNYQPLDPNIKKAMEDNINEAFSKAKVFDPEREADMISDSLIDMIFPKSEKTEAEILIRNIVSITQNVPHKDLTGAIYELVKQQVEMKEREHQEKIREIRSLIENMKPVNYDNSSSTVVKVYVTGINDAIQILDKYLDDKKQ